MQDKKYFLTARALVDEASQFTECAKGWRVLFFNGNDKYKAKHELIVGVVRVQRYDSLGGMMAKEDFRKLTPQAKNEAESSAIYEKLACQAKAKVAARTKKEITQQTKWVVLEFKILAYYRYHLGEYTLVV